MHPGRLEMFPDDHRKEIQHSRYAGSPDCHPQQTCLMNLAIHILLQCKRRQRVSAPAHRKTLYGGVLLVALLVCVILGTLIGSYLTLVQNQHLSDARAQAWNAALVVAEAGIEEGMAHLNSGVTTNNLAVNSWFNVGEGIYEKTNFVGDSYSIVDIKIHPAVANPDPLVVATAYVPGPISRPMLTRTVQVATKGKSVAGPPGGMIVTTTINLKGGGIN